ncbi:MAG TPA: ribonuclease P protein component [Rhodocyclaceae bacterium]|nr:ribonuclease P protein component [Rhodocyclaceae bacterium]
MPRVGSASAFEAHHLGGTAVAEPAVGSFRFPARNRLHRPEEFGAVLRGAVKRRHGCFELCFSRPNGGGQPIAGPRLGIIIPKRLARTAVLRNLLKRLVRDEFRLSQLRLPAGDMVIRLVGAPDVHPTPPDATRRRAWRLSVKTLLAGLAP